MSISSFLFSQYNSSASPQSNFISPKISFQTYRIDDINEKLSNMGARPLDVMVTGVTGAGKSTTLNALFQKTVAEVGSGVDPMTKEIKEYRLNEFIRIWDTPGLGDGIAADQLHKKRIIDTLHRAYKLHGSVYGLIDLVLVIIEGSNRDLGTTYALLNDTIVPNIQKDRILIAINQADVAMKGRHWNALTNTPDAQLLSFLKKQASSVKNRIYEATGVEVYMPIFYSAQYGYNMQALFDFIIKHIPRWRRG